MCKKASNVCFCTQRKAFKSRLYTAQIPVSEHGVYLTCLTILCPAKTNYVVIYSANDTSKTKLQTILPNNKQQSYFILNSCTSAWIWRNFKPIFSTLQIFNLLGSCMQVLSYYGNCSISCCIGNRLQAVCHSPWTAAKQTVPRCHEDCSDIVL